MVRRWQLFYSRLNQVESRELRDEEQAWFAGYVIAACVPERLVIHPRALSEGPIPETGAPCPACAVRIQAPQVLAACTACLAVYHRGCLPTAAACLTPACARERARG